MFRREAVERWGGYADGEFPEDWGLRWLDADARMEKLSPRLLTRNDPPGRATRVGARYREAACNELRGLLAGPRQPLSSRSLDAGRMPRRRLAPLWWHGIRSATYIGIDPRKIGN
ncbi:hypothetical protein [uncultured Desulfovibrio sp.]|uniref:hypothetical protein n=1 Tax=uncultured Desulfovibrio sp. TaxID=167968 RepID=UPI00260C6718|nr:hypothetical protein [uncultured Desulfovibrio sp.]